MPEDFPWDRFRGNKWAAEKVGDTIQGQIVKLSIEEGRKGQVPVVTLATPPDGHEVEVWPPTHLQRTLADIKPRVGDKVKFTLTELRNTGQPKPMKVFDVAHRPAERPQKAAVMLTTNPPKPLDPDPQKWDKADEEPF